MSGKKIEQARQALRFSLEHLNPRDRFNVIRFHSEVDAQYRLWSRGGSNP